MFDYFIGAIALIIFSIFMYLLGNSITKNKNGFAMDFVIGYIVYSFCSALVLVPIQIIKLSWWFAFSYELLLFLGCIVFIFFSLKTKRIQLSVEKVKTLIKDNYFLVLITLLLFIVYLLQFDLIWINNHLDDGYYLTKIATLPYLEEPFSTNYSTGLIDSSSAFDSYLLSSYELENSIFLYILHIDPVIYCRVILNIFNYFLAACTISAFAQTILSNIKVCSNRHIQYFSIILLLFAFEYLFLERYGLLVVRDAWQFNSAMWYGSSISRMLGLMWILIIFLPVSKITIKEILEALALCVVLISKSAIAVPLLFVGGLSILGTDLFFSDSKKRIFSTSLLLLAIIIVGFLIPNNSVSNEAVLNLLISNKKSIIIYGSILFFLLGAIKYWNYIIIRKLIIVILFSLLLIIVPQINDSFEMLSQYSFVAMRFVSSLIYTFVIIAFIFFILFIKQINSILYKGFIVVSLGALFLGAIISTIPAYGNPLNVWKIMKDNYHIMPNSTIELSKVLGEYTEDSLNVLGPDWVTIDNHRHALSVMLRVYAPNIVSVSAIPRFGVSEGNEFSSFGQEQQNIYNSFAINPNKDTYSQLSSLLGTYPVNCIVFNSDCFSDYAAQSGFKLYATTDMYYIYTKI